MKKIQKLSRNFETGKGGSNFCISLEKRPPKGQPSLDLEITKSKIDESHLWSSNKVGDVQKMKARSAIEIVAKR